MSNNFVIAHTPKWNNNPKAYLEKKLKILTDDFCIRPSSEELTRLSTLKTQEKIDNAIFGIITSRY